MKHINTVILLVFLSFSLLVSPLASAQVCATPEKSGDNLTLNGTVNSYWTPNLGTYNSLSTSITIGTRRGAAVNIAAGDLVLIVQIQCANINVTDTAAYGDGNATKTEFGSVFASGYTDPASSCLAGRYEYLRAGPLTTSTSLDLASNPLVNTYIQANAVATSTTIGRRTFQVIRVPQYRNATLSAAVTAPVWDGLTGGVVALDVANQLNFATNSINVDGLGFRGGGGRARSVNNPVIRYRSRADTRHAVKGEGIVGTPRYVSNNRSPTLPTTNTIVDLGSTWAGYPSGTTTFGNFSRGAPGNAGGGGTFWDGTSDNGGGGGGGNGGAGGRGGAGWKSAGYAGININYSNLTDKKWGFGGTLFTSSVSRLVLGGGGGAGDNNNNSTPQESSGAAGGGIVMIRARQILGAGSIFARGARASNNSLNDGAGAGGAGGSVIVVSSDMSTATLAINAAGGRGGDPWLTGGSAHGTGGGGGGGVVYRTGAATVVVTGGTNGLTNIADTPPDGASHGAKPGNAGINLLITVPNDTPGINTGFRCLDYGDAPLSYGLASHNLNISPTNLRIGNIIPDGDASILTAIPSANANFDDLNGNDDEDGVTLPSVSSLQGIYTSTVSVVNNSGSAANLCGWMDFDQDGIFQSDEGVCASVASMVSSQSINLVFTVPIADRNNSGQIFGRFRLTTAALTTANPSTAVDNGEIEDYSVTVTTLPVSLYKFESKNNANQLIVNWGTASETNNAGFNLWAVNDKQSIKLNKRLIPSKNEGVLKSTDYKMSFDIKGLTINELALSAVDVRGKEELFGYYAIGKSMGRNPLVKNIDWMTINTDLETLLKNKNSQIPAAQTKTHATQGLKLLLKPHTAGMQRVTYEELLAYGLDLKGVSYADIAVSINSVGVSRYVGESRQNSELLFKNSFEEGNNNIFGTNQEIEFWAKPAEFPDAEYLDFYTYEISVNSNLVKQHQIKALTSEVFNHSYLHTLKDNTNNAYAFTVPAKDPWYAKRLINFSNDLAKQYSVNFEIDSQLISDANGLIKLAVSGGTDMPENPDHEVGIFINEQLISTTQFNGVVEKIIETEIPANILNVGQNEVTIKLTEGTQALYDIVTVDEVVLSYRRNIELTNGLITIDQINNNETLLMSDSQRQAGDSYSFYAYDGDNLSTLESELVDSHSISIANNNAQSSSYWLSKYQNLNTPDFKGIISEKNLITADANYVIIAHSAFIPAANDSQHSLNRYMNARAQEGWNIKLVSVEDVQNNFGGGMNLPSAITTFLKAYQKIATIEHVLLVGNDSYDYKNYLGINSTSFIPTKYTSTLFVPHTPSDSLLADINGDGLTDISLGRWPVRTINELDNIVEKTLNWSSSTNLSAIYITDVEENRGESFESQASRMIDTITQSNMSNIDIIEIYPNNLTVNTGENIADVSRELLFSEWQRQPSLTNFIGHGSATQWSRQGILVAGDLDNLNNQFSPTLIGTLSCYSSYFVSPTTNSLSLTLMNSSSGKLNGAVAVHGAATLSSYSGNEVFANHVLEQQLKGVSLGKAILSARLLAQSLGYDDQVVNWTLLGDPTLKLNSELH